MLSILLSPLQPSSTLEMLGRQQRVAGHRIDEGSNHLTRPYHLSGEAVLSQLGRGLSGSRNCCPRTWVGSLFIWINEKVGMIYVEGVELEEWDRCSGVLALSCSHQMLLVSSGTWVQGGGTKGWAAAALNQR